MSYLDGAYCFQHARVEDFVRFAARRFREWPSILDMRSDEAFELLLDEYAALSTNRFLREQEQESDDDDRS
jgi:hypothetical protein